MNVSSLGNDVKVAATVAMTALGTGISTIITLIPNDIGKLASLVAIVLTVVLIRNHLRNGKKLDLENEKLRLEVQKLAAQEEERKTVAADRREQGLPVRRNDER